MNLKIAIYKTEISKKITDNSVLEIKYNYINSFFGKMFIASTEKGICYLVFETDLGKNLLHLKKKYPKAKLISKECNFQAVIIQLFKNKPVVNNELINFHLIGTSFQLKVWQSILAIKMNQTTYYSKLADNINHPKATRAIGTAVGNNPIAFFIPCHRVVQKSRKLGRYKWGILKKNEIIEWEKNSCNL